MTDNNILSIDKETIIAAFTAAIQKEATAAIKQATQGEDIAKTIREAFLKKWGSDRDSWIENEVKAALHQAMWQSVRSVMESSGINEMLTKAVSEYISTPEFAESIKRRAIETVRETTFYIKPQPEGQDESSQ